MAAAWPRTDEPAPQDDPDAPARAELARLLLEGARRLRLRRQRERECPPPWPEHDPTEDLDEPAIVRKRRREGRRGT